MKRRIFTVLLAILMINAITPWGSALSQIPGAEADLISRNFSVAGNFAHGESVENNATVRANAIDVPFQYAAESLNTLGLFQGTSGGYELERVPNRQEITVMQIRLMGLEQVAVEADLPHPFADVDPWASPYIGMAYSMRFINGLSPTTFGAHDPATAAQYLTLILRSLGYSDETGDFLWDSPWTLSDMIGLTNGHYSAASGFTRGDMAFITYNAMGTYLNGQEYVLFQYLKLNSVIPLDVPMPHPEWQPRISVNPDIVRIKKGSSTNVTISVEEPGAGINYIYTDGILADFDSSYSSSATDLVVPIHGVEYGVYGMIVTYMAGTGSRYAIGILAVEVY